MPIDLSSHDFITFAPRSDPNQILAQDYRSGISKRYLHELFSDTNKTVSQFIREERLIAAREAIAFSRGKTLAEIAYRFGFTDQAQFSRLFRAMFGLTPTEWKRQRDGSAAGAGSPSVQMAAGSGGTR